jgi:hypothetical protein
MKRQYRAAIRSAKVLTETESRRQTFKSSSSSPPHFFFFPSSDIVAQATGNRFMYGQGGTDNFIKRSNVRTNGRTLGKTTDQ